MLATGTMPGSARVPWLEYFTDKVVRTRLHGGAFEARSCFTRDEQKRGKETRKRGSGPRESRKKRTAGGIQKERRLIDRQRWKEIKKWKRKNEGGQGGWKPKVKGEEKKSTSWWNRQTKRSAQAQRDRTINESI